MAACTGGCRAVPAGDNPVQYTANAGATDLQWVTHDIHEDEHGRQYINLLTAADALVGIFAVAQDAPDQTLPTDAEVEIYLPELPPAAADHRRKTTPTYRWKIGADGPHGRHTIALWDAFMPYLTNSFFFGGTPRVYMPCPADTAYGALVCNAFLDNESRGLMAGIDTRGCAAAQALRVAAKPYAGVPFRTGQALALDFDGKPRLRIDKHWEFAFRIATPQPQEPMVPLGSHPIPIHKIPDPALRYTDENTTQEDPGHDHTAILIQMAARQRAPRPEQPIHHLGIPQ